MQYTYFSKLSGGEKRRLYLLTVLIRNPNFLILDEPTNDLDLLTLTILEDFLMHYKGCLVVVSHDRYFMDKMVDHLLIFEGDGGIRDYNGTYTEYRMAEEEKEKARARVEKVPAVTDTTGKISEKKKFSFKEKMEFEKLEKEIAKLEEEKTVLTGLLSGGSEDHVLLNQWALRMQEILHEIDEKSMRWLELSELGS
jgi:ATP-binding cassette subfamily F protein uup